jgi:hypothetical protein
MTPHGDSKEYQFNVHRKFYLVPKDGEDDFDSIEDVQSAGGRTNASKIGRVNPSPFD